MLEYITLLSGIVYFLVSIYGYTLEKSLKYVFYTISSLSFLIISAALAFLPLDQALSFPATIYLGTIYPTFLALGILYKIEDERYWKYFLYFVVFALILIAIGKSIQVDALAVGFQILAHTIAGLLIVFLPLIQVFKKEWHASYLLFSLGGIVIGIGGMALAFLKMPNPPLDQQLVIALLHPLLFISAFLIAFAVYLTMNK